jgi:hypothetical protein
MPVTLTDHAKEQGSFLVPYTFKDLTGTDVTPTSATWTLTDIAGTIINSREDVTITIEETATVNIVLQGDDLALDDREDNLRIILIKGVYDDPTTSETGLPYRDEIRFYIDDLVKITS